MKKLLHIIATPRGEESRTLRIAGAFIERFRKKNPACVIEEIDLYKEALPDLTAKKVDGKYILLGGKDLPPEYEKAWKEIIFHIKRFLSADGYLISTPMWNFGIPYVLKHYIDVIAQPKYLFRYTDKGAEGLAKGRKMVVVSSRGGDYSAASPMHSSDLLEPYLRTIFGLAGIADIAFINAQPMDALGPKVCEEKIKEAQVKASEVAENF
ncbi:MAG: NAD(P)H-dependent oxidoreductase [Candidatus Omnitrophota bacterium]|jgi:FMN-dependent NADH-azoreductase